MNEDKRVIYSFFASASFHFFLFALYFRLVISAPKTSFTVIDNVNLFINEMPPKTAVVPASQVLGTWDFLKLSVTPGAMARVPRAAKPLEIADARASRNYKLPARLSEKQAPLNALDKAEASAARSRAKFEDISAGFDRRRAVAAEEPALEIEEVGVKRAKFSADDIVIAKRSQRNIQENPDFEDDALLPRRALAMIIPALAKENITDKTPGGPASTQKKKGPAFTTRHSAGRELMEGGGEYEIGGPLAGRKVLKTFVPKFPEWARERDVTEARIIIRFYVDPDGKVLTTMRVEQTSGYSAWDAVAMDALKKWLFAPLERGAAQQKQYGTIMFRFILD